MRIVDTHCHVSLCWYEPVESLLYQMDRNGVDKAVLIQLQGQFDNEYQFECVRRFPGRFASVVLVDADQPDAAARLDGLAQRGARGVRLTPDSPGEMFRKAAELGLVVSCVGTPEGFAAPVFAEVLETLPDLPVIIEHLGGITAWADASTVACHEAVFSLARYSNAHMKIHGLGEFCRRSMPVASPFPFDRGGLPLLERACEAFRGRVMWGSDFPPVSFREGYASALKLTMAELASRPEAERAQIFGGLASTLFRLE